MNLLTDELPETLEIDGKSYRINTDFRDCLRIIMAFEDNELTMSEKQYILLNNLYLDMPEDTEQAVLSGIKFLNGGDEKAEGSGKKLYSFSKDANFVFAAFKQTHGVDLQIENMHWWKFLTLFMDLGSDTVFCNLVNLRNKVKSGKATKEEKAAAREMGSIFEVPELDTRTLEEREMERKFLEAIGSSNGI